MEQTKDSVKQDLPAEANKVAGVSTTTTEVDDAATRIAQLEAEKVKLAEERDNYRTGMLKAKAKNKNPDFNEDDEESEDDRLRRIVREEAADSKIADIAREQQLILNQALKELKEVKLANMNKTTTSPASMGTHTETPSVQSTSITSEQLAYFKAKGWNDKDIERFKLNLSKKI